MAYEWMIHFGDESILKDILQSMVRLLERKEEPDSFVERLPGRACSEVERRCFGYLAEWQYLCCQ